MAHPLKRSWARVEIKDATLMALGVSVRVLCADSANECISGGLNTAPSSSAAAVTTASPALFPEFVITCRFAPVLF